MATARPIRMEAPAKVNLHLGIYTDRDERGYHRADSVMAPLALHDDVEVERSDTLMVEFEPSLDVAGEKTAVARAVRALAEALGEEPGVRVRVERRIPDKSGLGSSSTDAATTLRALCALWDVDPHDERVVEVARRIGADVAFFLDPVPSWLDGVGDRLREAFPPLPGVPVVLVRPAGGVSTVEAYAEFDRMPEQPADPTRICEALRAGDVAAMASSLANNLQGAACRLEPEERTVVEWLAARPGVVAAQVTGSGSCVFGLCEDGEAAEAAAWDARMYGWWSCATTTA